MKIWIWFLCWWNGLLLLVGADFYGRQVFPPDNPWNLDVSQGVPIGFPYNVVHKDQPPVKVVFWLPSESDPGPYPIPPDAEIEGGPESTGDRHLLTVDVDSWMLYEIYKSFSRKNGSRWDAYSGAVFNLSSNDLRPIHWTSADAAGLPLFPGLVRYDEVSTNSVNHAFRFTVQKTRRAFVNNPARHFASLIINSSYPPMGMRVRLKASYDISRFSETNQVILQALKKYGMFLADNGGDWSISGAPSPKWDNHDLHKLGTVKASDFEVIEMHNIVTNFKQPFN